MRSVFSEQHAIGQREDASSISRIFLLAHIQLKSLLCRSHERRHAGVNEYPGWKHILCSCGAYPSVRPCVLRRAMRGGHVHCKGIASEARALQYCLTSMVAYVYFTALRLPDALRLVFKLLPWVNLCCAELELVARYVTSQEIQRQRWRKHDAPR